MPRGPLPAEIYWRRRLLLLALLIGLAWLVLQIVGWVNDRDEPADAATPAPTAASTASPTPSPEPSPEPTDLVPVALPAAEGACAPENIRIVPSVADGQPAGEAVTVDLLVSTVDGSGCVLSPEEAQLLVIISSGGTPVYDSTVCRQPFVTEPIAVPEGWATQASVQWSGRGSGATCGDGEGFANAGEYAIQLGTLGGEPGEATFRLAEPRPQPEPEPQPEGEPEPEPQPEGEPEQPPAP
ncbi:hypothetical protein [Aeromicrobium camelliae]|uniref:hypothetical protein n=1 Tax=Aeromicrobium camelliae TaxID=1538144 RepID=UPI00140E29D6|nr:hypothetical protein [Aeromicrobium camelliae]